MTQVLGLGSFKDQDGTFNISCEYQRDGISYYIPFENMRFRTSGLKSTVVNKMLFWRKNSCYKIKI